jgi:hypothetical protein
LVFGAFLVSVAPRADPDGPQLNNVTFPVDQNSLIAQELLSVTVGGHTWLANQTVIGEFYQNPNKASPVCHWDRAFRGLPPLGKTPIHYFELMFPMQYLETIIRLTNEIHNIGLTSGEFMRYIGLRLNIPIGNIRRTKGRFGSPPIMEDTCQEIVS